jgi:putative heme-binding domain-containing protein
MLERFMRTRVVALLGLALLAAGSWCCWAAFAQAPPAVSWIWFDEGDPHADAPAEVRYFRRVFTADPLKPGEEAILEITADNGYRVWLNGTKVGSGNSWQMLDHYDVRKRLVAGKNVFAVEARNEGGPAGLLVRLSVGPKGKGKPILVSDRTWKSSKTAAKDWRKGDFDDSKWSRARELVLLGGGPWQGVAGGSGGGRGPAPRFTVPEEFVVEQAVATPETDGNFSLVNMTFDARGRLLVSREGGPVLLCTDPDEKGVCQTVRPYCKQVTNCQGMCWVDDALLLIGDGPQGTGLYRCRDTKKADEIDTVELLHRFEGGMGEHGPHAVLHGPDGWVYFVIGNHAHARIGKGDAPNPAVLAANSPLTRWPTGRMGPDQGKPGSTEDVLLPRQNDANGHAANLRAPGGTIWRVDKKGQNISLVAAGFRNQFDAAFSPTGELFTFDSDMEWDEGLPWYRPVRICHCPLGAELGWRTGSSKIPPYAIDTLPAIYDTGRGSPVGLEFYDHFAFPSRYHGAYFMADWSLGIIYAVHLHRDGATYKADVEKFCTGTPMPVTDLAVAPDGSLWFTMGGRNAQGGVYRIVPKGPPGKPVSGDVLNTPQPLAAWSRTQWLPKLTEDATAAAAEKEALDTTQPAARRIRAITLLTGSGRGLKMETTSRLLLDRDADVRAQAIWALGIGVGEHGKDTLVQALHDRDGFVCRRACEALIRRGFEPPVSDLWPLLSDNDRFVRTAARLVLQRIDPKKWTPLLWEEGKISYLERLEGIIALCKTGEAAPYTEQVFARLRSMSISGSAYLLLAWLRTTQLALCHTTERPASLRDIAESCWRIFPHADVRVSRELAILLAWFGKEKVLASPVQSRLLEALEASARDRQQQIHYFYCLRLLKDGWTADEKARLLAWYDGTKTWSGGASFTGYLENILRDAAGIFTAEDVARLLAHGETQPRATSVLLRIIPEKQLPPLADLIALHGRLMKAAGPQGNEVKTAVVAALGRSLSPEAQAALRRIGDTDPSQREAVVRSLLRWPTAENFPYLLRGLDSPNKVLLQDLIETLRKCSLKPKAEDPAPYRALLLASTRLDAGNRWKAVQLLRHWTGNRQFGADDGDWQPELAAWAKWFGQSFPKEPALPDVASDKVESKYRFDELLTYLQGPGRSGDVARGRVVFEKALCLKCHKYGKEGEGLGPDLTTLSKRFKRADILESILYPSKVISDQYRSTAVVTKKGQQLSGLLAINGDRITVLLSDGSKVSLKKDEIEQQYASLVSVMPERLLDPLSKPEIADLFAFLESEPAK